MNGLEGTFTGYNSARLTVSRCRPFTLNFGMHPYVDIRICTRSKRLTHKMSRTRHFMGTGAVVRTVATGVVLLWNGIFVVEGGAGRVASGALS